MTIADTTCGKSPTEDPVSKEKAAPEAPVITLEGIDSSGLTVREQREWSTYVSEFLSPCPNVPVPIAQCIKEKRDCAKCAPAAKYVLKGVKDGLTRDQVEKVYKNRFDPEKVKNVAIDGSPSMGNENAPITIVEFADFQCPHCGEFAPVLDKLVESRKNDVRLVYKFYVLGKFPNSENAAKAAVAAWRQGKFWEMHHAIFSNQQRLTQPDIDGFAKELGIDVSRLHAEMQAPETADRIAKDRALGEELKIEGTPAIYINGRPYDGRQDLNEWINLELQMMGRTPSPATSGSAGGARGRDGGAGVADAGTTAAAKSDAGK